jgi:hypothetical protein
MTETSRRARRSMIHSFWDLGFSDVGSFSDFGLRYSDLVLAVIYPFLPDKEGAK